MFFLKKTGKAQFESIGMFLADIKLKTMENTIKRTLSQLVSTHKAVWDFDEQQQNLWKIVQDKKINELTFYLSVLNAFDLLEETRSLESNWNNKKEPRDLNTYIKNQFLKRELENEAKKIAKELDSLSEKYKKGGENPGAFKGVINLEEEQRFCSKMKIYFFH
jgi:hypothetical protein